MDTAKNAKFPYDQSKKIAKDDIEAWVDKFLSGELKPSLKSEPLPESNDAPVKVIVGKNYKSIVEDPEKDVFIEFYAPWCGHCKKLAPIWDELAESVKSDKVVIAKMDATANDLPADAGFTIQGFPTLKLVKANTNEVLDYEGDRTLASMAAFLKKNAVHGSEVEAAAEGAESSTEESSSSSSSEEEHDEL
jgi:protein disulfide-isomerase A1